MNQDLKIIKKKYGEDMAKLCRELFPTLLEIEGFLPELLINNFEPNHSLYKDIINQGKKTDFKNYIYSLVDELVNEENYKGIKTIKTYKTPKKLLSEAGYDLYECKSEKEIQSFKKYYARGEELCTFNGGRLNRCRVFFAVKKDVNKIKRRHYKNPRRQDKYGTSVISIQFTRDSSHTLSIKNRYNHTVNNPDATFSNNLDNIIEGLTESFEKEYGLIQQHKNNKNNKFGINGFEIIGYVKASDGKYHKYNLEMHNISYGTNNIIIDNFEVKEIEKGKYIVMDYFILDLVNKEIKIYDEEIEDSFPDTIKNIEKIEIEKEEKNKKIKIKVKDGEDIKIVLNENDEMIKLENPNVKKVGDNFLCLNKSLQELNLPNLYEVGDNFLHDNKSLQELNLPNLQEVRWGFLYFNKSLQELNLPNLREVGSEFLHFNNSLRELNLPNLREVGSGFLHFNNSLQELILPNLQKVGDSFLHDNRFLRVLMLPNLQEVGRNFLYCNNALQQVLNFPNLREVGDNFLHDNNFLQELILPNLQKAGNNFLYDNRFLQVLNLPNLQEVGDYFLYNNNSLQEQELNFPNLEKEGSYFLYSNDYRYNVKYNNVRRSK